MALVKLSKPIKPGWRRPFTLTADEAVDLLPSGKHLAVEIVEGDSTVLIGDTTPTEFKGYFNGDGALGSKLIRLSADGHIGEGEATITLDVAYEVATPDATAFGTILEGTDEPIPA